MICLEFHKDTETSIIKFQKQFIYKYNGKPFILYAVSPLFVKLEAQQVLCTQDLKNYSQQIDDVIIQKPIWDSKTCQLCSKVQILINKETKYYDLVLVKAIVAKEKTIKFTTDDFPILNEFCKNQNVFILSDKVLFLDNCYKTTTSVWKKLHHA